MTKHLTQTNLEFNHNAFKQGLYQYFFNAGSSFGTVSSDWKNIFKWSCLIILPLGLPSNPSCSDYESDVFRLSNKI